MRETTLSTFPPRFLQVTLRAGLPLSPKCSKEEVFFNTDPFFFVPVGGYSSPFLSLTRSLFRARDSSASGLTDELKSAPGLTPFLRFGLKDSFPAGLGHRFRLLSADLLGGKFPVCLLSPLPGD